jgi:hypothetical protein
MSPDFWRDRPFQPVAHHPTLQLSRLTGPVLLGRDGDFAGQNELLAEQTVGRKTLDLPLRQVVIPVHRQLVPNIRKKVWDECGTDNHGIAAR